MARTKMFYCDDCGIALVQHQGEYCDSCIEDICTALEHDSTERYLRGVAQLADTLAYSDQLYLFNSHIV